MTYPFDIKSFIRDNKDTVKKYLKKNTYDLDVGDLDIKPNHFYKNNPGILKTNVELEYSFLQKLEYIKCMKKINYFAKKYVKIISIDDGIIPFRLYDYQENLLELYHNNRFVISMQCRQSGKTQVTSTYILHFATFNPTKTVAILANKAAQAREILSRVQMSYESLPYFLKQGVSSYNKGSMKFGNLSEIFCAASSSSSIRGKSVSLLYLDEAAFIRNDMEFYESTYPVISSGKDSRVIITSTPNGARGLFYKIWTESVNQVNRFVHMMVPWYDVPGRDEDWKLEQIANTSIEQFNQEHGLIFRGSQNSLISSDVIARLPIFKPVDTYGDLKIYEHPKENHQYLTTVDTARGVGKDYSAFVVFDITASPYKVVATYKNNRISPMMYPQIIKSVCDRYNESMVLVEINDIGEQVASILYYDYEYENLLMCFSDKNKQTIGFIRDARLGVRTTVQVKSIGCANVKTLIETDKLILTDENIINEFGTFIPKGKGYEADEGANDDLAMCCVLFSWAVSQQFVIDAIDKDIRKDVNESDIVKQMMEDLVPFGIISSGEEEFAPFEDASKSEIMKQLGF